MANTTGRIPSWPIGTVVGTPVIGSVGISSHGSHSGLGSSLR
uniref:Photosystem II protein J n=1 Tax=Megaloselaginella exaltata TaxID=3140882 RepID=A0A7U3TJL4_9TRAC|nr:photosystem II protein J [Selaginella exaltata]